jgi:hypothetical protein
MATKGAEDDADDGGLPLAVGLLTWIQIESVMRLYQARQATYMMIVGGVVGTLMAWIVLGVAIALGLPAWPTSVYGYGYTLNVLNWFSGIVALVAATRRNDDLVLATGILLSIQLVVNLIAALLQIIGGISALINLNTTPALFALITSLLLLLLTIVTTTGTFVFYDLILKFRPRRPTFARRSEFVLR